MKTSRFFLILMAMVMSFGMIACGGDDNKNDSEGGGDAISIIGVWRLVSINGDTDLQYEGKRRYTFNSDRTYLLEDQKNDNMTWRKRNGGTYVYENNKITFTRTGYYSGSDFYPYDTPKVESYDIVSLTQNSVVIKDGEYILAFVRESNNGGGNDDDDDDDEGGSAVPDSIRG